MFIAQEVLLDCIRKLRPVLAQIKPRNRHLHDQLERSSTNALLNCAEARRRKGLDRKNRFGYAAGEADEARQCLEIAEAWQLADAAACRALIADYDRALRLLWPNYR
jgi:four helix bundle protein